MPTSLQDQWQTACSANEDLSWRRYHRISESSLCVQESNDLITEGVKGSKTLVWMANRSVRVLPLPVLAAMNGHTAFVQELHLR